VSNSASTSKRPKADGVSASAAKLRLLKRLRCTLNFEKRAWAGGAEHIAGVDEVGRGSLFGPVVAGAVILDPAHRIRGLRDSKLLPAERREELALLIRRHSIAWAVAAVDSARIDQINIYQASRLAMLHAVQQLVPAASYLLVDAVRLDCDLPQQPIIHGDALSASIAAAPQPARPAGLSSSPSSSLMKANASCGTGFCHTGANDWRCNGLGPCSRSAAR